MLVSQTSPVWFESFPYVKTSFFPRYICMGADHVNEKAQLLLLPKVQRESRAYYPLFQRSYLQTQASGTCNF